MKYLPVIFSLLILTTASFSQTTSSKIEIYKLYSENEAYYLKSIPFDNEEESMYGKTYVFKVGQSEPLYTVNRHFNYLGYPNKINLSNNGQTIFYLNDYYNDDNIDEQKVITVYTNGLLTKQYAVSDLIPCDENEQECDLLYLNNDVINDDSTSYINNRIVFEFLAGTSKKERFANNKSIFSYNDSVFLIDQYKQLRIFDLQTGELLSTTSFDSNYSRLASIARSNLIAVDVMKSPSGWGLPLLVNGSKCNESLANHLEMVAMENYGEDAKKYKYYTVVVDAIIDTSGTLEIIKFEVFDDLPEQKIRDFLVAQTYSMKDIPKVLEKWRYDEYIFLRKKSIPVAIKEKKREMKEGLKAYLKRLKQDTINGFYIPKNLGECFVQLDTLLNKKDREAMKAMSGSYEMSMYHFGLGTYLRNNWGLWGGSRLEKYFIDRGVDHPDSMSGIILDYYHDWLNGKPETWKDWEKEHPVLKE